MTVELSQHIVRLLPQSLIAQAQMERQGDKISKTQVTSYLDEFGYSKAKSLLTLNVPKTDLRGKVVSQSSQSGMAVLVEEDALDGPEYDIYSTKIDYWSLTDE